MLQVGIASLGDGDGGWCGCRGVRTAAVMDADPLENVGYRP